VFAAMNIKGYVAWSSKKERQNSIETATFERSKS
jgi:hypothetical protein